jgi:hypothetical protein
MVMGRNKRRDGTRRGGGHISSDDWVKVGFGPRNSNYVQRDEGSGDNDDSDVW